MTGVAEEKGFTNVRVVTADANHFQVWGWGPPSCDDDALSVFCVVAGDSAMVAGLRRI